MDYDVFNGDADGICALIQLRLVEPRPDATLVTGVKRDIQLLGRIPDEDVDRVTALDISFDKNRGDVDRLLAAGADLFFCDHHFSGDIPEAANIGCIDQSRARSMHQCIGQRSLAQCLYRVGCRGVFWR